jgi:hypothetical protein
MQPSPIQAIRPETNPVPSGMVRLFLRMDTIENDEDIQGKHEGLVARHVPEESHSPQANNRAFPQSARAYQERFVSSSAKLSTAITRESSFPSKPGKSKGTSSRPGGSPEKNGHHGH